MHMVDNIWFNSGINYICQIYLLYLPAAYVRLGFHVLLFNHSLIIKLNLSGFNNENSLQYYIYYKITNKEKIS